VAGPSAEGRAYRLIRRGVALAVVHTAFDVVDGGAADALAEALGLEDISGFGPNWGEDVVKVVTFLPAAHADDVVAAMAGAGAGRIGAYSACSFRGPGTGSFYAPESASPAAGVAGALNHEAEVRVEMIAPATRRDQVVAAMVATHPYEEPAYDVYETVGNAGFVGRHGTVDPQRLDELAARVAAQLACVPRVAGAADRRVRRVAVVPGSGGGFVSGAAGVADVLVTGDVGHHQAQRGLEQGLCVVDAGHVATERPGVERLYAALAEQVGARSLLHLNPSPWREG
jgi:putative NIF3 family GTP cyclohydrolase 1 type 2